MEHLNSKVLLFGEYAVLNKGMALVMPWDKYQGHFEFYGSSQKNTNALQSNEYLRKFCAFISSHMDDEFVLEVKRFEKELEQGLFFKSNIPQGYGLGSSGALVSAIVLRYLVKAKVFKDELKGLTLHKLNRLKDGLGNLESHFHGVSSGLDPLSIILNEPVLFKSSENIVTTELPKQTKAKKNVVFLLDSRLPRTTSKMMALFKELNEQSDFKKKFDRYVIENNDKTISSFLENDTSHFFDSMYNLTSFQLQYMKDFFPKDMQKVVAKGLNNGDYFLKLCGAGGGGFVLGFTADWEATQKHLKDYTLEEIYRY